MKELILDMDSSESPMHGQKESAWEMMEATNRTSPGRNRCGHEALKARNGLIGSFLRPRIPATKHDADPKRWSLGKFRLTDPSERPTSERAFQGP